MASKNDITGDKLISKVNNKNYDDGYDRIFDKSKCLECDGTGFVDYPIIYAGTIIDYICPECNGTGKKK